MRIALLCSGLGNVHRGHEVFARSLFDLIGNDAQLVLFKGGGDASDREVVIEHIPRDSPLLDSVRLPVSSKWHHAAVEGERMRVEGETFAYAALKPLLEGEFDVIHCLEQEVCNIVYAHRHLFAKTPKILFSNGGAIPGRDLPNCDFVQEHSEHNLSRSKRDKAFVIPHGVDTARFNPSVKSNFRERHGIPRGALVVISVGTICYWHKRMDYVIREVARLDDVYLVIVGQRTRDTPEIEELGRNLMGNRVIFESLTHAELPSAYAAADVFVLGSLFETFGIVYIEAMAMGLPVICTNHPNQRGIVKEGIFIDMSRPGGLADVLRSTDRAAFAALGLRGRQIALRDYDLEGLKTRYLAQYQAIASSRVALPRYSIKRRVLANARNLLRRFLR